VGGNDLSRARGGAVEEPLERDRAHAARPALRWRIRTPLVVAGARLRSRPGRAALVAVGVAASVAGLVAVDGASVIARDREVQTAVASLPVSQRSFRVDAFGLPLGQSYARADRTVTRTLATLSAQRPLRGVFFRELRVGGGLVQLAGIDRLDRLVRLRSGRVPRTCTPARCEVLTLGPGSRRAWRQNGIDVVRVGSGTLVDRALFGDSLQPARELNGTQATVAVTAGVSGLAQLPALQGIDRSYSWIAPIDPRRVHVWEIGGLLRRESLVQDALARSSDVYQLSGPDVALADAQSKGRVAARRLLLLGGEAGTLLLGFALVAATGLRRGLAAERRRLRERGARRPQLWLAELGEVGAMTGCGVLAGAALGAGAVAIAGARAGVPVTAVLVRSLGLGAALVAAAWFVATAAVLAAARVREREPGSAPRLRPLDVAALGAGAVVALGVARGDVGADALSTGGDATLLLLLPGLVCFVAAVAAARALAPLMRLAERAGRGGPLALRLALLALARAPARTLATAAFLLVSLGLALFAAGYRTTLERGAGDEAAFAVPLDYALTEGTSLVPPPLHGYSSPAYPILRLGATVPGSGTTLLNPTVLGVPAAAVARLHWRSDYSGLSQRELARRLGADGTAVLRGVHVGGAATLPVRIRGVALDLDLAVQTPGGAMSVVPLGEHPPGRWDLRTRLPRGRLVGLEVAPAAALDLGATHREAELGAGSAAPVVTVTLGDLRGVTTWRGWVAVGGARLVGNRLSFRFGAGQTILVRLPQPTDRRPLRVVTSPDVAAAAGAGGALTLDFGNQQVAARIVGVAARFPDSEQFGEGFVVADESQLAARLDARMPGTGTPGEVWLSGPPSLERSLTRLPVDVASRREIERALVTDPLARALVLTLAVAALAALGLAALGVWLAFVGDLRDERGELYDLEAQGLAPAALAQQFRVRAALLLALGLLGGVALGFGLSRLVVALVRVSAATESPQPPLRYEPPWLAAAAGLAAVLVACAVLVELTVRRAFRDDTPPRASWSLE